MRSKGFAILLAFLAGSSGAQRFYTGQVRKGWIFLLICWILLPGIVFAVKYYELPPTWQTAAVAWVCVLLIVHIAEGVHFIRMHKQQFNDPDMQKGNSVFLTAIALIAAVCFGYGSTSLLHYNKEIDIDTAKPEFTISSLEYSQRSKNDEQAFIDMYHNKVLQVNGRVASLGNDFEDGNIMLLNVVPDATDLQCYFSTKHQNDILKIQKGDSVIVIGICDNGRFMRNCKIEKHIPAAGEEAPVSQNSGLK